MSALGAGGSATCVIELEPVPQVPITLLQKQQSPKQSPLGSRAGSVNASNGISYMDADGLRAPPTTAVEQVEKWNFPRRNIWRTSAAFLGFAVMGMNDAAIGALIPYLETYYNLNYAIVSLVFLSPLVGYTASAMLNNMVHLRFGQRGVALICPTCHIIAYAVASIHPPFPVLVVIFMLAGFGNGLEDAAWNAWVGNMARTNEVLGFLHAFYGLGATVAPIIATSMITQGGFPWYYFYYLMLAVAALELLASSTAFWSATGAEYRAAHPRTPGAEGGRMKEALFRRPAARVTWICSLFLFVYVGAEVALGGWITTFMLRVRHGSALASGIAATGFWAGMTLGRVVLGFVTPRIGEWRAVLIYLPLCIGLQLLFWLVPQFYVSAVAIGLQGFFLGPLFPAAVVATTKLLPRHLHVGSVGFAAAFGGGGAAMFPFAVGAIAQARGVQVLQPIVLAMLCVLWVLWFSLPRMGTKRE